MNKEDFKIIIVGEYDTGKSTIAFLIKNILEENGLDCYIKSDNMITEEKKISEKIKELEGKNVIIEEVLLQKTIKK